MDQLYFDATTICGHVSFPDLFITFICNPYWLEIQRLFGPMNLQASNHPDIISRVFKIKLEEFFIDLTKKMLWEKYLHVSFI